MCGVGAAVGPGATAAARAARDAVAHRGPDGQGEHAWRPGGPHLAHARLAVIDPTPASAQPFVHGRTAVAYNGELWNYRELGAAIGPPATAGDVEVVARALDAWPGLAAMEGMWAFAWTVAGGERLRLCRDRFGEVPLHYARLAAGGWVACSELKGLVAAGGVPPWLDVPPGGLVSLGPRGERDVVPWYRPPPGESDLDLEGAAAALRRELEEACRARAVADVPACTLLSGGIDSSAVAALLRPHLPGLVAYHAVMDPRSPDLRAAREVAAHLGLELREVAVPAPTAADLADVVRAVEMPHKAQVEIGWPCLRLAEAMRGDGYKVTFSGEGSDELWASYGFAYHGVRASGWRGYRERLFLDQHRKNFARVNKVFLARGVEPRLPFLHTRLVELALSLRPESVRQGSRPKAVLERAVADLLPARVLRRQKLAFQDGLGVKAAAARAVADPRAYYRAEFRRMFGA